MKYNIFCEIYITTLWIIKSFIFLYSVNLALFGVVTLACINNMQVYRPILGKIATPKIFFSGSTSRRSNTSIQHYLIHWDHCDLDALTLDRIQNKSYDGSKWRGKNSSASMNIMPSTVWYTVPPNFVYCNWGRDKKLHRFTLSDSSRLS